MGTHPIFESDFDCLTDLCRIDSNPPWLRKDVDVPREPLLPSKRTRPTSSDTSQSSRDVDRERPSTSPESVSVSRTRTSTIPLSTDLSSELPTRPSSPRSLTLDSREMSSLPPPTPTSFLDKASFRCYLDTGLARTSTGARIFGVLKG